jgi:putative ABC transport system substrate-binding protein
MAEELIATQPDLLLTPSEVGSRALLQSTRVIPIVFSNASDPVGLGLVPNLQHPGGNVTGLTSLSHDLAVRRLQLVKDAFPQATHIAVLFTPDDPSSPPQERAMAQAAAVLKIRMTSIAVREVQDIATITKRGAALNAQAYVVTSSFVLNSYRREIIDAMLRSRMPAIYSSEGAEDAGGLMRYGPSSQDNFRRSAGYVDKILKGAKPGDLPIEQPTKFELVINMKTAKAMGLAIPQSVLLRADRLIE